MGSNKTYKIDYLNRRVLNYLRSRGFTISKGIARSSALNFFRGPICVLATAPGKWSGRKTDWIVERIKHDQKLGLRPQDRGMYPYEDKTYDPLEEAFGLLTQRSDELSDPYWYWNDSRQFGEPLTNMSAFIDPFDFVVPTEPTAEFVSNISDDFDKEIKSMPTVAIFDEKKIQEKLDQVLKASEPLPKFPESDILYYSEEGNTSDLAIKTSGEIDIEARELQSLKDLSFAEETEESLRSEIRDTPSSFLVAKDVEKPADEKPIILEYFDRETAKEIVSASENHAKPNAKSAPESMEDIFKSGLVGHKALRLIS